MRLTPKPDYLELEQHDSGQALGGSTEGSISLSTSNDHTGTTTTVNGSRTSLDAPTITPPARISTETSTGDTNGTPSEASTSQQHEYARTLTQSPVRERRRDRDVDRDRSKGKRVQTMLKNQVHNTQARINTISKKIGHGVARGPMSLYRSSSAPGKKETSRLVHC